MPFNPNFLPGGSTTPNYPGTNIPVTHSFEEREITAEFDDALVDQKSWKNIRYDGSRETSAQLNIFTAGDNTYQNLPTITRQTTALYIANTVIGGTEDPQFATIKNHSYVGINKIILVDPRNNTVQLIDKASEPFVEFHRFITNDFPTGNKAYVKIIDESIQTNLKGHHRVKMNKGYLLKSLEFKYAGETSSSNDERVLTENNTMYVYKSGSFENDIILSGSNNNANVNPENQNNALRFRFGMVELYSGDGTAGVSGIKKLRQKHIGPLFISSSIISNKFTDEYYTGSFGLIGHRGDSGSSENPNNDDAITLGASSLGSASRFLGIDTLNYLSTKSADTTLTEQEKTEVHITFFEGTKDFAPGAHDERSIGTFEVDQRIGALMIEAGDECNGGLPTNHELVFKGRDDGRFLPTLGTFKDDFQNAHMASSSAPSDGISAASINGCNPVYDATLGAGDFLYPGTFADRFENIDCFVQGGAIGTIGFEGAQSASAVAYGVSLLPSMSLDNYYSGSFRYDVSFLDKDHTLILDLDKDSELFDGIGNQGLVLIPQDTDARVAFNVEFFLAQAGIITSTVGLTQNTTQPLPPGALP